MATSPLTDATVPQLDYPDLIRRAWAGERVLIHDGIHPDLVISRSPRAVSRAGLIEPNAEPFVPLHYDPDPVIMEQKRQELRRKTLDLGPELTELLARLEAEPLDPSLEATMARARKSDAESMEPRQPDPEFADLLEEIVALRRPLGTHPWD